MPRPKEVEKKSILPEAIASRLYIPAAWKPRIEWLKYKLHLVKYHELTFDKIWDDEKLIKKALKAKRKRYLK